ncbi:MAG: hypothetical protein ACE5G0_14130 [Rhodothermales bacterium]
MPIAALQAVRTVCFPERPLPVEETAAAAVCRLLGLAAPKTARKPGSGLCVGWAKGVWRLGPSPAPPASRPWMWVRVTPDGEGELTASEPALLYALARWLVEGLTDDQEAALPTGLLLEAGFAWNRPLFDTVLTQTARSVRGFEAESYVEHLARCGFTHLEVNGLASHTPHEPGVPGEFYPAFYTYCPGLNQFVESVLTQGLYPAAYLQANLRRLKDLAALGRRYGLNPGLLCFEPRSLPERFFQRYPTLRGARVDHPFRSHLPRYTLAQDHPVSRDHYRQLMRNLMTEVPDLAYLSVWTNDSGAGFEHTASLYVGRNGGPYLIREWRSHEQIAEAAGRSAVRWLRLMQETAAEINPDFEVSLRIEPFKVEHDTMLDGMGNGLTIEAPSLLVRGYDLPYHHPKYEEQGGMAGSLFHVAMEASERDRLQACRAQGFEPKLSYAASSSFNLEPLLGIPFPRMLHRKLVALRDMDARCVSAMGGLLDTTGTPYWPNPEVIRAVQLNPTLSLDDVLHRLAERWVGVEYAGALVDLWDAVEDAVSWLPVVPLYSHFGFVWLRTWVRPLIPNLEAVPAEDRQYYECFMVSTANNPNINDLGKDVLFDLITQASGQRMADRFDANVQPRLDDALAAAYRLVEEASEPARAVLIDLRDRIRALRCWATTQRNTCAWVAGVYGYLEAEDHEAKAACYAYVQDMIDRELVGTRDLLDLWETSDTAFMLVSGTGETPFLYGENFGDLLRKKIALTERYRLHEPYIDREIIWRIA